MMIKYRVHDVAKDLNIPNKEVIELLNANFEGQKKHMTALTEEELDLVFEDFTKKRELKSFDEFFATKKEEKAEVKEEVKPAKAAASEKKPKEEQKKPANSNKPMQQNNKKPAQQNKEQPKKRPEAQQNKPMPKTPNKKRYKTFVFGEYLAILQKGTEIKTAQ